MERGQAGSNPHFTSRFASYDARTVNINHDLATFATTDGRVTADFVLHGEQRETPHSAYLYNGEYDVNGARLHYDQVECCFYLHMRTKSTVRGDDTDTGDAHHVIVLGVDLGITNIATTSTGRFWSSDEVNHWHRGHERRRFSLQQTWTRWAHENEHRFDREQIKYYEQMLHIIFNELAQEIVKASVSTSYLSNTHATANATRTWKRFTRRRTTV